MSIFLIFPNTLFEYNFKPNTKFIILEEPTYFTKFVFHKQKLVLHRASMKFYYDYLCAKNFEVKYIEFKDAAKFWKSHPSNITCFDPIDHPLRKKLRAAKIKILESPDFLYSNNYSGKLRHEYFYKWQRKRLNILMDGDKPLFDKWSFDNENRHPFNSSYSAPAPPAKNKNSYVIEAKSYVLQHFSQNFGEIDEFFWPTTFVEAKAMFRRFLQNIENFGPYQDAMAEKIPFGSHSLLSSSLNIGLITPKFIIENLPRATKTNISSIEAFVRQLIGWRCYTRFCYENFKFKKHKPSAWKKSSAHTLLGIKHNTFKPISIIIEKVKNFAYMHHIERLMLVGNFALISQIKPEKVYDWFMVVSIDSYEWVMMSNVYEMSQSTNSRMMTRPYFSGSNYLRKMAKTLMDEKSCKIWDALYYNFINRNKKILLKNYITSFAVRRWNKMSIKNKQKYIKLAKSWNKK